MSMKMGPDEIREAAGGRFPSPPARVGKYRIDGVIGRGAMGIVYKGYDPQIDRALAVKTIRLDVVDEADREPMLKRFAVEARAAGRCMHPNIVTVFDYVEQDGAPYIVMEYINAGTLDQVIKSGARLPVQQVVEILVQLLLALDHAHSKGIVHRDVKPANILCPSAASIKVTDFGVARFDGLGVTKPGGVGTIGTPNYMSPEQFLGRKPDARSDLFSAGVILFQLLTGERPFLAGDVAELMHMLLNEEPPALQTLRPELPESLDAVTRKALVKSVEDRFQSASEFIDALTAAIEGSSIDSAPPLDLTAIAPPEKTAAEPEAKTLNMTMAERLSDSTMERLESALAQTLGPIARVMIKRAAGDATDAETMLSTLAGGIPEDGDASAFRAKAEAALREDAGVASMQLDAAITQKDIDAAVEALSPHIGPVAKVVAKRKAETAIGVEDYWLRLAEYVPDGPDRAAFQAKRPARSGGGGA